MSMLSVRSVAGPMLLAAMLAPAAIAEDKEHFLDLRVGFSGSPAPDVEERVKSKGVPATYYSWEGGSARGGQLDLSATCMCLHDWGGLGGAVHVIGADYDVTPTAVVRSDGTAFSPGGLSLHYRSLGAQFGYGYGYATSRNPEDLAIYLEAMPFIGGGGAQGETSGANSGGTVIRRSGLGYYYEYGVRGGLYFTERQFVFGVTGF